MSAPTPPRGAVARHRLRTDIGEIASWRHTDHLPALELSFRAAGKHGGYPEQPAHVRLGTAPLGPLPGITDPAELRQIAWCLLAAAAWLDRQTSNGLEPVDDPQLTIYDELAPGIHAGDRVVTQGSCP